MNNDIAEGKWKQLIGKAKTAWGELTDDELIRAEGRADKLTGLIQSVTVKRGTRRNSKYAASSIATGISDRPCEESARVWPRHKRQAGHRIR